MRRNSFRITLSAASLLVTFLACSSYAAKRSSSGGNSSPITVVIDAGHGGFDRGGIPGQRVSEKDMTLDVARRLKSVLEASGYRVVMTRDSDVFVPLGTRTAIANSNRNAIFVSVHFNSATRSGASGIETYFYSRDSSVARVGDSSLRCRGCAVIKPRRASPWLLRLAKDEYAVRTRRVRFSD